MRGIEITIFVASLLVISGASLGDEPAREDAMPRQSDRDPPALLFIQGKLKPNAESVYQQYLAGTRPLMSEYGVEVIAVGSAVESELTTDAWPINAVLSFRDRETAERFLADPRYLELKERYRDQAYETLHLTLVESRAPRGVPSAPLRGDATAKDVAEEAFADFRHSLATGEWQPFLDRLTDDFTLQFPMGRYQGKHVGKEKASEIFHYVTQVFSEGLTVDEIERITAEDNRVVFEFRDSGLLRGQPYRNIVAISLDVRGEKISGYREYFGLVGPPPEPP